MKHLTLVLPLILFIACNTQQQKDTASTAVNPTNIFSDSIYLVKNTEITPANSYSDLFLDSTGIEQFIRTNNLSADDERSVRSFYNYRNLQFAWFSSQGFTEQAKGFWNLRDKLGTKTDRSLSNKMDSLLNLDTLKVNLGDTSIAKTELALTDAYLRFFKANRTKTQFAHISAEKSIPVKKQSAAVLTDTLIHQQTDTFSNKSSTQYLLLRQKLQLYLSILQMGGWQSIPFMENQLTRGATSPVVTLLKKRLQKTGDLAGTDSSENFNDSLLAAVKNYQLHMGMKATGIISDTLIQSLNISPESRIQQIIINLSRLQWMSAIPDTNYLTVNIPDFVLTVFENNAKAFDMPVAVGKEGTNTTMFTGDMNQLVFSPYWNIPASIVKKEILPKIKADANYLRSKHMEIVRENDSLPRIRQLPGKDNALGKVKFLFPNRYDIYLHDSYEKDIFKRAKRDISHGCIRLADAEKLAVYLLRNSNSWTPSKVHEAMNSGKEQFVKLSPAMPVNITYYTAWVDETGQLNFRDDIYGNDKKLAQMMFESALPASPITPTDSMIKK